MPYDVSISWKFSYHEYETRVFREKMAKCISKEKKRSVVTSISRNAEVTSPLPIKNNFPFDGERLFQKQQIYATSAAACFIYPEGWLCLLISGSSALGLLMLFSWWDSPTNIINCQWSSVHGAYSKLLDNSCKRHFLGRTRHMIKEVPYSS